MSWVATAIAGSAILGAGTSLIASNKQADAAKSAQQAQLGIFNQTQGNIAPFMSMGVNTSNMLQNSLGSLIAPFNPDMATLENTPGYQFTLGQGEKAVTNANSAMGLGNSGVQGKGIANYAEGLAGTTFQQQFQNYWTNNQNKYNMLMGPTTVGANAAAGVMSGGVATGGQVGSDIIGAGNAGASGLLGVGASGSNAMNQYMQYMMLQKLTGGANNANPFGNAINAGTQPGVSDGGYNFLDAAA